jgi:hypothetical protein
MVENKFPPGWNKQRVQSVLAHYEAQSDDEAVAEDEAARDQSRQAAMEAIGATDMGPYTASGLAWRWNDPKYHVLPPSALDSIRALKPPKSRALFPMLLDLDRLAREAPDRSIQTGEATDKQVEEWLAQGSSVREDVIASWNKEEAVLLPWHVFTAHWSSFCYPSSDDVTIVPLSERWVASYSHEERFFWKTMARSREHGGLI